MVSAATVHSRVVDQQPQRTLASEQATETELPGGAIEKTVSSIEQLPRIVQLLCSEDPRGVKLNFDGSDAAADVRKFVLQMPKDLSKLPGAVSEFLQSKGVESDRIAELIQEFPYGKIPARTIEKSQTVDVSNGIAQAPFVEKDGKLTDRGQQLARMINDCVTHGEDGKPRVNFVIPSEGATRDEVREQLRVFCEYIYGAETDRRASELAQVDVVKASDLNSRLLSYSHKISVDTFLGEATAKEGTAKDENASEEKNPGEKASQGALDTSLDDPQVDESHDGGSVTLTPVVTAEVSDGPGSDDEPHSVGELVESGSTETAGEGGSVTSKTEKEQSQPSEQHDTDVNELTCPVKELRLTDDVTSDGTEPRAGEVEGSTTAHPADGEPVSDEQPIAVPEMHQSEPSSSNVVVPPVSTTETTSAVQSSRPAGQGSDKDGHGNRDEVKAKSNGENRGRQRTKYRKPAGNAYRATIAETFGRELSPDEKNGFSDPQETISSGKAVPAERELIQREVEGTVLAEIPRLESMQGAERYSLRGQISGRLERAIGQVMNLWESRAEGIPADQLKGSEDAFRDIRMALREVMEIVACQDLSATEQTQVWQAVEKVRAFAHLVTGHKALTPWKVSPLGMTTGEVTYVDPMRHFVKVTTDDGREVALSKGKEVESSQDLSGASTQGVKFSKRQQLPKHGSKVEVVLGFLEEPIDDQSPGAIRKDLPMGVTYGTLLKAHAYKRLPSAEAAGGQQQGLKKAS